MIISILPGFGQLYNGQILKGIIFILIADSIANLQYTPLISVSIQDIISIIYFIFYIYNLYDAYNSASSINKNNGNYFYNENIKHSIPEETSEIKRKFHELDIKISDYFHNTEYNGKKTVSVGKVLLIFIAMMIIDNILSEILNIPHFIGKSYGNDLLYIEIF